ncbi:MAG TPA: DNA cytosine methyltransferase, partial [Prosthecobacter sp.]|nr:DNA cytosine methyltransferase [Prosthecobacter sp.]
MGRVSKKPKIVDLFSGCGGFGLGAELGGFEAVVAVDLDPNLQSAYGLNFPTTKVVNGDVSKLDRSSWKNFLDKNIIDGVIGGPPCQGFSRIGKKAPNDPRNSLIGHFYRHVKLLKPKFFVMENVVGILDEASRSHLDAALDEVPGRYNVLPPIIVNAVDHGAPTNRRRVVVVGYDPADFCRVSALEIARASVSNRVTVRDAIADLPGPVTDAKNPRDFGWSEYPRNGQQTGSYVTRMRAMPTHLGWAEAI